MSWYLAIVVALHLGGYMFDRLGVVAGTHWGLLVSIALTVPVVLVRWRYIEETVKVEAVQDRRVMPRYSISQLRTVPGEIWKLIHVAVLSSFSFQLFWSYVVVYRSRSSA